MTDVPLARELALDAPWSGSPDHHANQYWSIVYNLALKKAKGTYDEAKAPKLWMYLADNMARSFAKEHGFSVDRATRQAVVDEWMTDEETQTALRDLAEELAASKRENHKFLPTMSGYVDRHRVG